MLDSKVPFDLHEIKEVYDFISLLNKRKLVYLYLKNNKIHFIVINFWDYNLLHLTGLSYFNNFENSGRFIKDLRRNKLNVKQLGEKRDGTTRLKLSVLKFLPDMIKPGVKISDNHLILDRHSFDSSILLKRTSILMLNKDDDKKAYVPVSLYNSSSVGYDLKSKIGNARNVVGLFSPSDDKYEFMSVFFINETDKWDCDKIFDKMDQINTKLRKNTFV